jgi:uncharacterized protein YifE (UPF0438 family)
MNKTSVRNGSRPFFDDINFPRGFSRSGMFTVQESAILQEYGHTLKSLLEGKVEAENEEEKQFITTFSDAQEPTTCIEKAWTKYLKALGPKSFYTLNSGSKAKPVITESEPTNFDVDL